MSLSHDATAWQARQKWRRLRLQLTAIDRTITKALDPKYVAPLTLDGVRFLEEARRQILIDMLEIERRFKVK